MWVGMVYGMGGVCDVHAENIYKGLHLGGFLSIYVIQDIIPIPDNEINIKMTFP